MYNEIINVLLHHQMESGELLQDLLKKCNIPYSEIFDVADKIVVELKKKYEFIEKEN